MCHVCACARALVACAQSCAGLSPITTGSPQYSRTQPHTLEKRPAASAAAIQRGSRSPTRSCLAPLEAPIGWLGSVSRWDLHIYRHGCLVGVGPSGEAMACQLFFTIVCTHRGTMAPKEPRERKTRSVQYGRRSLVPPLLLTTLVYCPGSPAGGGCLFFPLPRTITGNELAWTKGLLVL